MKFVKKNTKLIIGIIVGTIVSIIKKVHNKMCTLIFSFSNHN